MSQRDNGADETAFKAVLWVTIPTCVLIGLENLSTAVMLFCVVFMMMFFGLVPMKQLMKLASYIILIVAFVLAMIMLVGHDISDEEKQLAKTEQVDGTQEKNIIEKIFHRVDTWKSRIISFWKPMPALKIMISTKILRSLMQISPLCQVEYWVPKFSIITANVVKLL
jgi:cell division protein FtsW